MTLSIGKKFGAIVALLAILAAGETHSQSGKPNGSAR